MPNFKLHCAVEPGLARSHLLLRGIKGPRFIIDEEWSHVPAKGRCWEKFIGGPRLDGPLKCSELRWWKDIPDIMNLTKGRISDLCRQINSEEAEREDYSHIDVLVQRTIDSLRIRLKHYEEFLRVLACDSDL